MLSDVSTQMMRKVPGLGCGLTTVGTAYHIAGTQIGVVRSTPNRLRWRIDDDPAGYPFGSELEATEELLRRARAKGLLPPEKLDDNV